MSVMANLVVFLFVVKVLELFYDWYRLKHIPGSFWISSSKIWQVATQLNGNWYLELQKLGDKYGMTFLLLFLLLPLLVPLKYVNMMQATCSALAPTRS